MIRFSSAICLGLLFGIGTSKAQEDFLGKNAAGWAAQLKSANVKERRDAAFALGKLGKRTAGVLSDIRTAYAKETDPKVREAIIFALGEISRSGAKDANIESLFLEAIADGDKNLRRSAAFALGCLASKSPAAVEALEKALTDKEPMVRQNAAWALGRNGEKGLPALQKGLRDQDTLVRRDAAGALLHVTADGSKVRELMLKDLLPLCNDKNSEVRRAALVVMMRIVQADDKATALPPLKQAMENDKDIENKRNAAFAISSIGGDDSAIAVPVLLEAAKNGDVELRRQAVLAIRGIGPSAATAIPTILDFLKNDPDAKVREHAALAIGGMKETAESAIPTLVRKIRETKEDPAVRIECAMAMQRIGPLPAAIEVVPALLEVLGDRGQDPRVRERIMWPLRIHLFNLKNIKGPREAFTEILSEPRNPQHPMLRYDCAYMLGFVWKADAPDAVLPVLEEFLKDENVKIYAGTGQNIERGPEGTKGSSGTKEKLIGDGRVMATDALLSMGADRYRGHANIMRQLKALAADPMTDDLLKKKAQKLVDAAG